MSDKIKVFLSFVAGATVGTIVTWKFTKNKYEQIAQDEIDSVKEVFSSRILNESTKEVDKNDNQIDDKPDILEYANRLMDNGYADYSVSNNNKKEKVNLMDEPYVISPEECGVLDDYEVVSLTYYADQVLADENGDLIDDVDVVVGSDSLTRFGEYEDDSVFVRNDKLKCDYEILLDQRKYYDIYRKSED